MPDEGGALLGWMQAVQRLTDDRLIALDGKTLRGSDDRRDGKAAIHMVSAWAVQNKVSLGQVVVDRKSNEITAIPELLRLLEVSGAIVTIVTIDAMGCPKEIAGRIREGGDYVLAVKQDQPTLYGRVCEAVSEGLERDASGIDEHRTEETGHGRREVRTDAVFAAPEAIDPEGEWPGPCAVGVRSSVRADSRGRASPEGRDYILCRRPSAREFAEAVRGHWGVENNLQ